MTIGNVDNSTLNALIPNLDIGDVADPALRLAAFQYIYAEMQIIVAELNSIPTANLQNLSISATKLANLAVETGKIADLAVTTQKINDLAVTAAKIAMGTITSAQIADLGIATADLADSIITTVKLADASVITAKIADIAVTLAKMAANSVGTTQLVDLAVTQPKIAYGAVGVNQLATGLAATVDVNAQFAKRGIDVTSAPYNADPTGATDSSAAFIAAIAYLESVVVNAGDTDGNKRGRASLYIPPGRYLITQPEALMRSSYTTRSMGFSIQGAGKGITQIVFQPSTTGQYLLKNQDAWLGIRISDIEFISNSTNNNFMYSYSTGGAQNYAFERCSWSGTWGYGFYLAGNNTNSEMTWYHCGFFGAWLKAVYVPSSGSDQFLNYNFYATNFEVSSGDFVHFEKGGNINIWGGSFIHYGATGGTFFKLYTPVHAFGVQRFLCIGARFEHRVTTSVLIDCQWNDGDVAFINIDSSSSSSLIVSSTVIAKFLASNQKMPTIKFESSSLIGKHEYTYMSNAFYPHNVVYDSCEITQQAAPSDFISQVASSSHINIGALPVIKFRNCRGINSDITILWDTDYGFQTSKTAITSRKVVSLKNAEGKLPNNVAGVRSVEVSLPLNAIITSIQLYSPNGAVSEADAATFSVESTFDTAATTLATITAANYSTGFNQKTDLFYVCDTNSKRRIRLLAGLDVSQSNASGYCLVEYIG